MSKYKSILIVEQDHAICFYLNGLPIATWNRRLIGQPGEFVLDKNHDLVSLADYHDDVARLRVLLGEFGHKLAEALPDEPCVGGTIQHRSHGSFCSACHIELINDAERGWIHPEKK